MNQQRYFDFIEDLSERLEKQRKDHMAECTEAAQRLFDAMVVKPDQKEADKIERAEEADAIEEEDIRDYHLAQETWLRVEEEKKKALEWKYAASEYATRYLVVKKALATLIDEMYEDPKAKDLMPLHKFIPSLLDRATKAELAEYEGEECPTHRIHGDDGNSIHTPVLLQERAKRRACNNN